MNTKKTLTATLKRLEAAQHEYPRCDLVKIGSPGKPYRSCTCGLDNEIAEVKKLIRKARG